MIEYDVLKDSVPKTQRGMITPELVDKLNKMNEDPLLIGSFKENLLGYTEVLKQGKYKIEDYVNAVRYMSYKLVGKSDIDAYAAVFPERYQKLKDEGLSRSEMSPYASAYNKNKLVNAIREQTLIPSHILNAPLHQQALNEAALMMTTAKSEMARANAIGLVLQYTKAPETTKVELDVSVRQTDEIAELREVTQRLARESRLAIESGVSSAKDIAHSRVIKEEIIDIEVD